MSDAAAWIVKDVMDPARAVAMAAVLDRPDPGPALPPFWHHAYFWEPRPPAELGPDGHPRRGIGPIPDLGLPRRMWAGGSLRWHGALRTGRPASRRTTCADAQRKTGRTGPLALVRLHHAIHQDGDLRVEEAQDLVYRAPPHPDDPAPRPPRAGTAPTERTRAFDAVTLFRYSALTFNGHRIHYDRDFATGVEGHGGVVVHGPLLAEGLIDLATAQLGPLDGFRYRATAPLLVDQPAAFCCDGTRLWVRGPDGRLCMEAEATPR